MIVNTIKEFDLTVDGLNSIIGSSELGESFKIDTVKREVFEGEIQQTGFEHVVFVVKLMFNNFEGVGIQGDLNYDYLTGDFTHEGIDSCIDIETEKYLAISKVLLRYLLGNITMVGEGRFKLERMFSTSNVFRLKLTYGKGIK